MTEQAERQQAKQAQAESGPGWVRGLAQAWQARQGKQERQAGAVKRPYATVADGAKSAFTVLVGGFCPFLIAAILTISAGYYFAGLRPFTGDVRSLVAYGTAGIVEAVNLALFFVSAKAFWSGKTAHFMTALIIGLGLTVISVVAQVLYLSNNLDQASIGQGAALLQGLPLVGSLASTSLIIVSRALALHVAEFACCYVVARSAVSHRKIIQAQQESQEAEIALMESDQFMQFKRALHGAQMAQLESMRQMLSGGSNGMPLLPFPLDGAANGNSHKGNGAH